MKLLQRWCYSDCDEGSSSLSFRRSKTMTTTSFSHHELTSCDDRRLTHRRSDPAARDSPRIVDNLRTVPVPVTPHSFGCNKGKPDSLKIKWCGADQLPLPMVNLIYCLHLHCPNKGAKKNRSAPPSTSVVPWPISRVSPDRRLPTGPSAAVSGLCSINPVGSIPLWPTGFSQG